MPKEEWGVKRVCPTTGKRFYDLNKDPVVSPYTGEVVEIDTGKTSRSLTADKADKAQSKKSEASESSVEEADALLEDDAGDIELDDDLLEDDEEDDKVPLDDLADVASDDDES